MIDRKERKVRTMKHYEFITTCTMKEYNNKHWWIDSGYIRPISVYAENLKSAILKFREIVEEKNYITISDNAIKNKNPMYIDTRAGETKQTGYVFTGKTEFQHDITGKWVKQYIDLWVTIKTIIETDFQED